MNGKLLEEVGLTFGESKVYLALLRIGKTTVGPLVKKADVSTSKIYKILDKLQKKGLVGHVFIGKTRYFQALEPERIIEYLEEKEKRLLEKKQKIKEILPELKISQKLSKQKSEAMVYEGFKSIFNFYRNILTDLGDGEEYYVLGAHYGESLPGVRAFFHNYHLQRTKKNIKVKMLANNKVRKNLEISTLKKAKIKYLPQYLIPKMVVVFYRNKSFLFFLTKEPKGFLIESKEVFHSFQEYFKLLWKIAKT